MSERTCDQCRGALPAGSQRNRRYCSKRCVNVAAYLRRDPVERVESHRAWRLPAQAERKAQRWAENASRPCEECGQPLIGAKRSTRRYCSDRCTNAVALRERSALRREHAHRRRSRLLAAEGPGISERDWRRLVARYGGCCAYCGKAGGISLDHVVPLTRGGRHAIGNALPACRPCNSSKKHLLLIDWRTRILPQRLAA